MGVQDIREAFDILYSSMLDNKFSKSLRLQHKIERELLRKIRFFLLGYFGKGIEPEVRTKLISSLSEEGRLDFLVEKVAVEFAVRPPISPPSVLKKRANADEVKKLVQYNGQSALVLFDFSVSPLEDSDLEEYRALPILRQGIKKKPFWIFYYYKTDQGQYDCISKYIKTRRQ
jgi:hypothetical protein